MDLGLGKTFICSAAGRSRHLMSLLLAPEWVSCSRFLHTYYYRRAGTERCTNLGSGTFTAKNRSNCYMFLGCFIKNRPKPERVNLSLRLLTHQLYKWHYHTSKKPTAAVAAVGLIDN